MKHKSLESSNIGSCNVLIFKPGEKIDKHFHRKGVEIEYVYKGSSSTHKEGKVYVWKKKQVHELINDSCNELVIICLKIPKHDENDMNFILK